MNNEKSYLIAQLIKLNSIANKMGFDIKEVSVANFYFDFTDIKPDKVVGIKISNATSR